MDSCLFCTVLRAESEHPNPKWVGCFTLSMHALGEEREGKGRGRGARGGEWRGRVGKAKGQEKEKREEKKDTFIGE